MADERIFVIKTEAGGEVNISEEVIKIISGLAALEIEGVQSLNGGIVSSTISKAGSGKLNKCIRVISEDDEHLIVRLSINLKYGYEIPTVSEHVQDKVKSQIEGMSGLKVEAVDIRIASIVM